MNRNTAGALRAACSQVLGVLDDWESIDIRTLDVEDALGRFVNLRKKDFKPDSLETYKQRFKQALRLYLAYLADPGGWKPLGVRERTAGSDKATKSSRALASASSISGGVEDVDRLGLISFPFPLRERTIARLFLPPDVTVAEVRRLTAYMMSIALDAPSPEV